MTPFDLEKNDFGRLNAEKFRKQKEVGNMKDYALKNTT
jgi:hypothetical protein